MKIDKVEARVVNQAAMLKIIKPYLSPKWIALILILAVTPFYTRWVPSTLSMLEAEIYGFKNYGDIFAHSKSLLFISVSSIGLIGLILERFRGRKAFPTIQMAPVIILALLIFLSGLFSPYFPITLTGVPERYEGMWVHFGYLVLFALVITTVKNERDSKVIETILYGQMLMMGLICWGQSYGFNVLNWEPVRILITNQELARVYPVIAVNSDMVYGTLGNPGNLAQYCSFVLPFLMCIPQSLQKRANWRTGVLLLGWFSVFASGTGAALLGAGVGVIAGLTLTRLKGERIELSRWVIPVTGGLLLALPQIPHLIDRENTAIFLGVVGAGAIITYRMRANKGYLFSTQAMMRGLAGLCMASVLVVVATPLFKQEGFIRQLDLTKGRLKVITEEGQHEVGVSEGTISFHQLSGDGIPYRLVDGLVDTADPSVNGLDYSFEKQGEDQILVMHRTGMAFRMKADRLQPLNKSGAAVTLVNPPAVGFKGLESIFSCRGYIWSRSIPLMFQNPFLGVGSDAFVFVFPQGDYAGKFNVFGTPYMLIDKPHSMYLQYAIQQGLLAFLVVGGITIISLKKGVALILQEGSRSWQFPYVCSLIGFLTAAVFNDSLVHTTLFFWLSLGVLYPLILKRKTA